MLFRVCSRNSTSPLFFAGLIICFIFSLLTPNNAFSRSKDASNPYANKIFQLDAISRPNNIHFPVVFYLSLDHPGLLKVVNTEKYGKVQNDPNITLPIYVGYLVVDYNNNYTYVSKLDKQLPIKRFLENIIVQQSLGQEDGKRCSDEGPHFCAPANTWNAVWVLLNDFYRNGIYVSAYTTGQQADDNFIPYYEQRRSELVQRASVFYPKTWPEFSNTTFGMKTFNRQAYDLPIYATCWPLLGSTLTLENGVVPQEMRFPLVYYISLTSQGLNKFNPLPGGKGNTEPQYAGYLVVDEDYAYRFTRKSPFTTSLAGMTNTENDLKSHAPTTVEGLYNMTISAPSDTWNGLGVFLAKIVTSGDYEIFAYSSGKAPDFNFNPTFPPQHNLPFRDNINTFSRLYENETMLKDNTYEGLQKFNSILFFEARWPELWGKGAIAPLKEIAWE